jgi:hypothetical protein
MKTPQQIADSYGVEYVSDWAARLRTRIYEQFKGLVTWGHWVDDVLGPQFQDLEDALMSLVTLPSIDDSEGVQLDTIGRHVGQPRLVLGDVTYRLYLKARIAANNSAGDPESLYRVFRALFGVAAGFVVRTSQPGTKTFTVRVLSAITQAQALIGAQFLGDAKEAGARGIVEWQPVADALLFTYDGTTAQGYDNGVYAGAEQA